VRGRGRRVVTPDGYVWFVRRRRARRRPLWWRRDRHPERFHGEDELPAEELPVPGVLDLFTYAEGDLGERGFDRGYDDRVAAAVSVIAIIIVLFLFSLLVPLTLGHVLPWLVPPVVAHARLLLGAGAALAMLGVLDLLLLRPWYVELQRQGLADAPRRVWRVRGWRRSGRLMGELGAAIREGRIDNRRAVILHTDDRP
jgi:hypothetical protein